MMIGTMVGNYKILGKIGEGGMGSVFQGIDIMLEREVAIKMLRPEFASQPNVVERFRTEAVTLAKLSHPNIATLHSFFRQRDDFFMVMEFVRGETLDSVIRHKGAMTFDHTLSLFCQSLDGIGHAHRMGIIHRDIKPANMMLTPEGSIKVMDFGIARVLGSARMTRQGAIVGTIEYMSPEQVRGEEGDARSDVYSLGLLLYEMLTGRLPFSSTSEFELMKAQTDAAPPPPRTFVAAIPLEVEQAIMRSLAKRAQARYQTADEFRAALLNVAPAVASVRGSAVTIPPPLLPRAIQQTDPASMHREVLKETRLAPNPMWSSATDNQIKETRLGPAAGVQSVYGESAAAYVQSEHPVMQPAGASLLTRLNWMHYAAAAIVLIFLIGAILWVIGVGRNQAEPQPGMAGAADPVPIDGTATPIPESAPPSVDRDVRTAGSESATPQQAPRPDSTVSAESGIIPLPEPSTDKRPARAKNKSDAQRKKAREARDILNQ